MSRPMAPLLPCQLRQLAQHPPISTLSPPRSAGDGCGQDCVCDMWVLSLVLEKPLCSFALGQAETEPILEERFSHWVKTNPCQPPTYQTPLERSPKGVRDELEHTWVGFALGRPEDQTQVTSKHAATSQPRFRLSHATQVRFQSLYTQQRWFPKSSLNSAHYL